jgi:hypothetical protein
MSNNESLTVNEVLALQYLSRCARGAAASMVATAFGKDSRMHRMGMNGGGPYGTQMLLGRMRKRGLVGQGKSSGSSVWVLTSEGRLALAAHFAKVGPAGHGKEAVR